MKLGVTGHRPPRLNLTYSLEDKRKLNNFAKDCLEKIEDIDVVYTGMAQGFDQAIAAACIKLNIPFVACIPFKNFGGKWPESAKKYYNLLLTKAKESVIICESDDYSKSFLKRDEYIVDNTDSMIALYDGVKKGGTFHTVNYAQKQGKKVLNFWRNYS